MNSQKLENQLNLALEADNNEREKSLDLNIGYDEEFKEWELIVKYSGDISRIVDELNLKLVELINGYAIIYISENKINSLIDYEEIEYIEKPKSIYFELNSARRISCITSVQIGSNALFGAGVIVAVIDSGVDYSHPDFRNEDGTSRILFLWDQTIEGNPPDNYLIGSVFSNEDINRALEKRTKSEQLSIVPSVDLSGHGTHILGIATGNGRASNGIYKGVASRADIIVVKLGVARKNLFPRTTQLMMGVDFCIRKAIDLKKPISMNLSFGNNYGSHDGNSLLETYLDDIANIWKSSIVVGSGNEGSSSRHTSGILKENQIEEVQFVIAQNEKSINLQIWKYYIDNFEISILTPSLEIIGNFNQILGIQKFSVSDTNILLYYGEPSPYNAGQEIYIEFLPKNNYILEGIWTIRLIPKRIVNGRYDMWLPVSESVNANTRFLNPSINTTLTIPSTANKVITVGAYNSFNDSYADFSGRGYDRNGRVKPDLVAPGVDIMSTSIGGGYTLRTGTSMATPFVTGSVAILMEWGIVKGNDNYLYGEKVKSYLIKGARQIAGFKNFPNPQVGYGALCLEDSF